MGRIVHRPWCPEGGHGGCELVAAGTPEDIVKVRKSYTGKHLKSVLT
ncbi:MAG: hypothetical protein RTU63_03820 [Candidatus Thorarchaeota archaeon]